MEKVKGKCHVIVVSDTTPLISLMKIGHLDLIEQMFGEIYIPDAVYSELVCNPRFEKETQQIRKSPFIKRMIVEDVKAVALLRMSSGLDIGESEAIILSTSCGADLLLMDEAKGRQVAKQRGIHLMGTVGMLRAAYDDKLMSGKEIEDCITVLRLTGRYISDKLFTQLLDTIRSKDGFL